MNCTNCGREVPETAKVCGHCGHVLKAASSPAASAPFSASAAQPPRGKRLPGWIWAVVAGLGTIIVAGIFLVVFWKPSVPDLPDPFSAPAVLNIPDAAAPPIEGATCEDRLAFVRDVTVPDGAAFKPGEAFTKTWRIKNAGTCTWTTSYRLAFAVGQQMGAPATVPLTQGMSPGQESDISINMAAPSAPGSYRSDWRLQNADGMVVPLQGGADNAIFAAVTVLDPNVLLYDDFNDPSSGWSVFRDQNGEVSYQDGNLRIALYQPLCFEASWSPAEYTDFVVETDFSVPRNIPDVGAGLTLRASEKAWYLLWIYPAQGKYLFQRDIAGQVTELVPLTESAAIRPSEKAGRYYLALKVEARGDRFDFWTGQPDSDFEYLGSVSDSGLSRGRLGPSADCPDMPFTSPAEVLFEWIRISK